MKGNDLTVFIGGLMRCCTETIRLDEEETVAGDSRKCRWCASFHTAIEHPTYGLSWQWDRALDKRA